MAQKDTNPFPYSDTNKRYYTYEYYLRRTFGGKVAKLPVDGGFTCPNIDGKCGTGGCIYCSGRGSGDFAPLPSLSVTEQLEAGRRAVASKWKTDKYIAYFQAHTNTYAPVAELERKFREALAFPGVVGLNVATRADCLGDDVVALLSSLAGRTRLTVELGLQSADDGTARLINRGHDFGEFLAGYGRLRRADGRIGICVHLIFGLPGENEDMMLESVRRVAALRPDQVKLHLLYVIKGTRLGEMFERGEYAPMEREAYINTVVKALTLLPKETVIARLTGDGAPDTLLAPLWSRKKTCVVNDIDKALYSGGLFQGMSAGDATGAATGAAGKLS